LAEQFINFLGKSIIKKREIGGLKGGACSGHVVSMFSGGPGANDFIFNQDSGSQRSEKIVFNLLLGTK
jgi:hypothetical protein